MTRWSWLAILAVGWASLAFAEPIKPKYGPEATLLRDDHGFLQSHPAPLYWALSPYYLAQRNDESCSLATVAMVVNAARVERKLATTDDLATQEGLLARVKSDLWTKATAHGGDGVTLDQLRELVATSLKAYGVTSFKVDAVHVETGSGAELARLEQALAGSEAKGRMFVVANFLDGVLTGDGNAGHFSPIGAYDAAHHRALVFDVDRTWYEPYWVSSQALLRGMATLDKDAGRKRGYLTISGL
jgi:hypothetical protein